MTKGRLLSDGLETIFMIAMVLVCYGIAGVVNGNAYLSLYLFGIMIGNSRIRNKQMLIPFFDGVTSLAQILIFFLIGLLTFPHQPFVRNNLKLLFVLIMVKWLKRWVIYPF